MLRLFQGRRHLLALLDRRPGNDGFFILEVNREYLAKTSIQILLALFRETARSAQYVCS